MSRACLGGLLLRLGLFAIALAVLLMILSGESFTAGTISNALRHLLETGLSLTCLGLLISILGVSPPSSQAP